MKDYSTIEVSVGITNLEPDFLYLLWVLRLCKKGGTTPRRPFARSFF